MLSRMFFNFSNDISLMSVKGGMSILYTTLVASVRNFLEKNYIFPSTTEGAISRFVKCNAYQMLLYYI